MDKRNFLYLFYGLTVAWGLVAAYLFILMQRSRKLRAELDRVKRMVGDSER
jgi:CcmD family protein